MLGVRLSVYDKEITHESKEHTHIVQIRMCESKHKEDLISGVSAGSNEPCVPVDAKWVECVGILNVVITKVQRL